MIRTTGYAGNKERSPFTVETPYPERKNNQQRYKMSRRMNNHAAAPTGFK